MRSSPILLILASLGLFGFRSASHAQDCELAKLLPTPTGQNPRELGASVAVDDGCFPFKCSTCDSGAVYVFDMPDCLPLFRRGDDNGDGVINIADPVFSLAHLFQGGPSMCLDAQDTNDDGWMDLADPIFNLNYLHTMGPVVCEKALDTNDDGVVDIADPIYNLAYIFNGGPPPPPPFPGCGQDLTVDSLECLGELACP